MLPTEADFSSSMQALGLDSGQPVVVYEQEGVFSAPRAWWMLRVFGVREVYVLDGGLRAWKAADLPVGSGVTHREKGDFQAKFDHDAVRDFAQLQRLIDAKAQILDARSAGRFAGTAPEPRPGLSSGHMPGATSVPFLDLTASGRMKSPEELQKIFAEKYVDLSKPITTTCGSGVTAAVVLLGAELAGAKSVSLYDGSWAEYASRPEVVIEKS